MNDLTQLLRESFEYSMTNVHTAFPGVVVKYDAKTRRADIQPSIKRKLPSGEFTEFPVIPEVPVIFTGTKKYTMCFPLEKDDEVLCVVMERGTDVWRDNGGSGNEETDPRRFDLMDCVAIPGLQPIDFVDEECNGFRLLHEDCVLKIKGDKISFKNKSKDLFSVFSKILDDVATAIKNIYSHSDIGSPYMHTVRPDDKVKMQADEQNIKQDKKDLGEVMEIG